MSDETVLVLRTCDAKMRSSYGDFVWPESGPVSAPDWDPTPECGHGLHGLLRGEGDGACLSWGEDSKWLVVEVLASEVVPLSGGEKIKFPRGIVVCAGDRDAATAMIASRYPDAAVVGGLKAAGDGGTATAGDGGTATAGYRGTATAGYRGTATAGNDGTATAGDYGTATAGDGGTATAGNDGTATAGDYGTATAGNDGTLAIWYWDAEGRSRLVVAYVGEDGILPDVAYRLDPETHAFVRAPK